MLLLLQAVMTPELLRLETYDRVFQRLVSTHKEIPLAIYRTCPISKKRKDQNKNTVSEGGEGREGRRRGEGRRAIQVVLLQ